MTLTELESNTFGETHLKLLLYAGQKGNIIKTKMSFKKFTNTDMLLKLECRDFLLENKKILDDYITLNSDKLTADQIEILLGFKKTIISTFVIFKCLSNNAIFIDTKDNKFYAVKALKDRFDDIFEHFPVLIETTILPFKDKIVYDGFVKLFTIDFGKGIRSMMNENYKIAKKTNKILTTL